ncbi:hypothetical protein [Pseudomonas agarici]|nr:hypothetical protein [Pseudomonas agarici]
MNIPLQQRYTHPTSLEVFETLNPSAFTEPPLAGCEEFACLPSIEG